ncbi:glycosyltransferase family 2 protein [Bacillus sp. FJAT-49732]|uniref:Glycosyltransferase family 2 protein n=1 Tax=Lederbergia citrisecunda TaxID=2833583 RepID=A0A942TLF3_9BACI|nr:glycosyltransferase family 2 protein [Lederbergia citrisecunda]MBS4198399.1 glycosyltransferase family 2 protein [Lederbergia citrisecunda]
MKKLLTVFTPTYNRSYCLVNCYLSLLRQTSNDFCWLIIDDGSTDNTKELVEGWIAENKIDIRYVWQENKGMHGAHNTAYELIDTELNVCIDSDDYMPDDAVEKIKSFWMKNGNDQVSGIIGLDANTDNQIIGTMLPENIKSSTLFDLYNRYGVTGDKKLVYRTELTKQFPYPLFENEKYVGLAYKYFMLDRQFEMLLMNEILCYVEYLQDGSSLNMFHQYRKNPRGFAFYRKELMKLPFAGFIFKFRQAIHYVSSSIMIKNRNFISETPCKGLTVIAIPFGALLYLYIVSKTKTLVT